MTAWIEPRTELALGADPDGDPDDWTWTDISTRVRLAAGITITRGRANEGGRAEPTSISLTLDNRDGAFSPRNPLGPYYGLLRRNTPLRVTIPHPSTSDEYVRGVAYVSKWPVVWDYTDTEATVRVSGDGSTRRLMQGTAPVPSTMRRGFERMAEYGILAAYWPMEEGRDAGSFASATGGPTMYWEGDIVPGAASVDLPTVSDPVAELSTSTVMTGVVPDLGAMSEHTVMMLWRIPDIPASEQTIFEWRTTGAVQTWRLSYTASGGLRFQAWAPGGGAVFDHTLSAALLEDQWALLFGSAQQAGGSFNYTFGHVVEGTMSWLSPPSTGGTLGRVTDVNIYGSALTDRAGAGHMVVLSDWFDSYITSISTFSTGHLGERAALRMGRLAAENGLQVVGDLHGYNSALTARMGAQRSGSGLLDLLTECADADGGFLFEDRATGRLDYRSQRDLMVFRDPPIELPYASAFIALEPVDDDQRVRNDVTVSAEQGSFARAVDEAHIAREGRYVESITRNLSRDVDLDRLAHWRLGLGTVEYERWPVIEVELRQYEELIDTVARADLTSWLKISDLPVYVTPDDVEAAIEGTSETFTQHSWKIRFITSQMQQWHGWTVEDPVYGRVDTSGSTLAADIAANVSTLSVASAGTVWTTKPAAFPFDVTVGEPDMIGEIMTVTAVSGSSSPQTFTVTRAVNGIRRAWPSGTTVRLAHTGVIGLW